MLYLYFYIPSELQARQIDDITILKGLIRQGPIYSGDVCLLHDCVVSYVDITCCCLVKEMIVCKNAPCKSKSLSLT